MSDLSSDGKTIKYFRSDIVEKQAEQIAALQAELERDAWVSVEDRLPENTCNVLAYDESEHNYYGDAYYMNKEWGAEHCPVEIAVTHWKPITPPTGSNKE